MIYKYPHVIQIKPGIVVELTTEEAIKLIQELFRQVYGETPVPSNPPGLIPREPKIVPMTIPEPAYTPTWAPKETCPRPPFDVYCYGDKNGAH